MSGQPFVENHGSHNITLRSGAAVPFQVVQDVYNEITGKKEKLSKSISVHHQTTMSDIIQLNSRIQQTFEQYSVESSNTTVTVYHTDDRKEVFSSFERFSLFDTTTLCPVENINIEYNFLFILPKTKEAKSYKVSIDIHSRTALMEKAHSESGVSILFARYAMVGTGRFSIEYVDYAVASTVYSVIEKWFDGLQRAEESKYISFFQRHSHTFPFIFQFLTALITGLPIAYGFYSASDGDITLGDALFWGFSAFLVFSVSKQVAFQIGKKTEDFIDKIRPVSYLKFNIGDERIIGKAEKSNKLNKVYFAISAVGGVILNIISNIISDRIQYLP